MRIDLTSNSLILPAGFAATVFLAFPAISFAADKNQACVETLWPAVRAAGVTRATFDRAFQGFTPDPEVVEAANYQPEYVKPIGEYIDRVVSDKRIATGKQMLIDNKALLDQLEAKYGVDRHILIAIWGIEFELRHPARRQEHHPLARHALLHRHQGKIRQAADRDGAEDPPAR